MSLTMVACFISTAACAWATPPDAAFDWVIIGDPGNRAANAAEAPQFQPDNWPQEGPVGRVDHVFRMTRTEVTVEQWFEYVVAYAPYWEGAPFDNAFTSDWIVPDDDTYVIIPGAERFPANMSWRHAARFCNWLHNDRAPEQRAFESGVYDTSTFVTHKDNTFDDQTDPSPGARFWVPNVHEWTKAMYYDPDRYGPGEEGYWRYPNGRNEPSHPDWPDQGGETNAGKFAFGLFMDVGSYPWEASPYGVLDGSGSAREWNATRWGSILLFDRFSQIGMDGNEFIDCIDYFSGMFPDFPVPSLRLVAASPCLVDCNWDGALNVLDFVCFQQLYKKQNHTADLNADGSFDVLDFVAFQAAFQIGCD